MSFFSSPPPSAVTTKPSPPPKGKRFVAVTARQPHRPPPPVEKTDEPETSDMTYDVLHIDSLVRRTLRAHQAKLPTLVANLNAVKATINTTRDASVSRQARARLRELREEILDIESGATLADYLYASAPIIDRYSRSDTSTSSFLYTEPESETLSKRSERNELKLRYLCIARQYIPLTTFKQNAQRLSCSTLINGRPCGSSDFISTDDNVYVCTRCSSVTELQSDTPTFKDTERINMCTRYVYTKKGHFVDAMDKYEGKQNTNISPRVYRDIRKSMRLHNLTAENVTREQIYMFLSETGHSKRYEDINLIAAVITSGRLAPPDITKYRKSLLLRFDEIESVYSLVKDHRVNSMSVFFKLYKLLQLEGFPCRKDDFFILKTQAKTDEHEDMWIRIMEHLSKKNPAMWRYIETT
jgi:hypothetical protein